MLNQGLVWVLAVSGLFWAEATTATISGTVADQAGARLSRIEIVVTCIDNGRVWSVSTDKSGRFTAPNLPLGEYVLGAFSDRFMTATRGVRLEDEKVKVVDFILKLDKPTAFRKGQGVEPFDSPASSTKMETSGTQVSPRSIGSGITLNPSLPK